MKIRTVLGDIDAENAGHVQFHEHLLIQKGKPYEVNPSLWMDDLDASLQELQNYRAAGGGLVVDAQPVFAGRMPEGLRQLSEKSRVHMVSVTGFHRRIFYADDAPLMDADEEALCDLFVRDVLEGMTAEDGRLVPGCCGALKGAIEPCGVCDTKWSQVRFSALVKAARYTGAPLMFHVEKGADLPAFLQFLSDAHIDFDRVTLCHLDRTHRDAALHKELLQAGVRLNYDSVCRLKYLSHAEEIALISEMCDAGYASRITLSLDTTRARLQSYGGSPGLDFILTAFIERMQSSGIPQEAILQMTATNARAALAMRV